MRKSVMGFPFLEGDGFDENKVFINRTLPKKNVTAMPIIKFCNPHLLLCIKQRTGKT